MKKARKSKNIYDSAITYENIYAMWSIIRKTCKNKKAIFYFSLNLNTNINFIYDVLKSKKYIPYKYRTFLIFEPKPRLVMSQTVFDKIINHFVANFYLIPYLDSRLIDSNVATRKEKGSKYAMELIKKYYNKILINNPRCEVFCLKIDVSKYFYTIDHDILLGMLEKYIHDKDVINLIRVIVDETNKDYINNNITNYNNKYNVNIPFYKNGKGLSIGAMSSQFLAIFYLNELDHYIKEELKCKYYIRYMDDFLLLDVDKERLKFCYKKIQEELVKLKLNHNKKSNIYRSSVGYTFLGYRYQVINGKLKMSLNSKTYRRIRKKLDFLNNNDKVLYTKTLASYYGFFKPVYKMEGVDFKLKLIDRYNSYKAKYNNCIVLIKDGLFYKSFNDDGKIIWYLFDYKYINNSVSFGLTPYDKVLAKLNKLDIGYVVIDNDQEVLKSLKDEENYYSYLSLALKAYVKNSKREALVKKFLDIVKKREDVFDEIDEFLNKYVEE